MDVREVASMAAAVEGVQLHCDVSCPVNFTRGVEVRRRRMKKRIDYIMDPRDLNLKTWYLKSQVGSFGLIPSCVES